MTKEELKVYEEQLKPCPFCGKKATIGNGFKWFYVSCSNFECGVKPKTLECYGVEGARKAVEVWNKRGESRMTERSNKAIIKDMREIVKPFISDCLKRVNYEGKGDIDKAEFETEFEIILTLAEKAETLKGDLISRQAVLDEMEKRHAEGDCITKGFIKALPSAENNEGTISRVVYEQIMWERDTAVQQLKDLGYGLGEKPKENKGEWIPIESKEKPKDYDRVLITINGCHGLIVREARYNKAQNEFEVLHNHDRWEVGEKGLLAWQPLPEPYKKGE